MKLIGIILGSLLCLALARLVRVKSEPDEVSHERPEFNPFEDLPATDRIKSRYYKGVEKAKNGWSKELRKMYKLN